MRVAIPILDETGKVIGRACVQVRRRRCSVCRKLEQEIRLCDGPGRRPGTTCSAPLCSRCTYRVKPEIDYCPSCRDQIAQLCFDLGL